MRERKMMMRMHMVELSHRKDNSLHKHDLFAPKLLYCRIMLYEKPLFVSYVYNHMMLKKNCRVNDNH